MNDITIIIKTFERKHMLFRLLKSIEKYYKELPIIIVDDSKITYSEYILKNFKNLNIKYITKDFDIGLSKGRNILIDNVKTKYFVLCDDDFEFDERTNLCYAHDNIEKLKADILGGCVYNRISLDSIYSILWTLKDPRRIFKILKKEEFTSIYNGYYSIDKADIVLNIDNDINKFKEKDYYKVDICSNFFIANTQKIKEIGGWTPELLKVGEHEHFFLKAKKNQVNVYFTTNFGVVHYPKKTFNYMKYRFKAENYFKEACSILNINSFIVKNVNSNSIIYSYKS